MSKATVIPFGPQHPVLPEPLHLDLVVQDETVVDVLPQIGFIHRGLEKLVETRDYNQFIYIAERICGICAMGHSLGYAETVESLMGMEVPKRAGICASSGTSCPVSTRIFCGWDSPPTPSASSRCSCTAGVCASACSTCSRRPPGDGSSCPS